jgi:NAD(P)-dependent dehydrogenase (short-subunit alcohol dehydrogenase family)
MPKLNFDPAEEIPSLESKVILITGGTAGLGYETVLGLAAHSPAHIYFTGRSQSSADKLIEASKQRFPDVAVSFIKCDLTSLNAVREAARKVTAETTRLDVLNANAGVMALPPGLTEDGYEIQFGTNHVGHALLVKLLLPLMERTTQEHGDARVVWNTSVGYAGHAGNGIDLAKLKTTQEDIFPFGAHWVRYSQSKLANLLYARALAKHHPTVTSVSLHPGVAVTGMVTSLSFPHRMLVYVTNIWRMLTVEQCAWNQQWAATAPLGKGEKMVESGCYYEPIGIEGRLLRKANDDELAEKLWQWTQLELDSWTL